MIISRTYEPSKSPSTEQVTGRVWSDLIAVGGPPFRVGVVRVHLDPGARTCWHQHPLGQILHILSGQGLVQERGGPVHAVRAGDTVVASPRTWHWHGASPHHTMSHLGIQQPDPEGNDATWGDKVTDDEYLAAPTKT